MATIRTIIIDEQPVVREGIRAILERMSDCVILGGFTNKSDVLEIVRSGSPDVALLDAGLISSDPLEIAHLMRLLSPHIGIILLTPSEVELKIISPGNGRAKTYWMGELQVLIPRVIA